MMEILLLMAAMIAAVIWGFVVISKIQHHHEMQRLGHEINNLPIPKHILFGEEVNVHIGKSSILVNGVVIKNTGEDKRGNRVYEIFDPRKPERFSHVPCGRVEKSTTIDTGEESFEITLWLYGDKKGDSDGN